MTNIKATGNIMERNPAAREEVLPGVGHLPPQDAPAEFNRVVEEFLRELPWAPEMPV